VSATADRSARRSAETGSPWSPFRHAIFTVVWIATVISNIGGWMYDTASGWLMTTLNPDPLTVALVQVAASLPMFLFALPAGALADVVDRRRLLIIFEIVIALVSTIFAVLVWQNQVTPLTLLLFTFLIRAGGALTAPAWQSIVPQLVPKSDLHSAIAANSVSINISRAIGPALGGILTAWFSIAVPFWVNAVSNLGVIGALIWWQPHENGARHLPAERLGNAVRTGIRHEWHNPHLRSTLWRALAFFLFASAYWALLPLVARNQIAGGPELYGVLLGAIGAGAVGGAFFLPRLNVLLGPDRLVAAGSLGTAITLALYRLARDANTALVASFIAGFSWIAVLSSLNVSAQVALPEWVRGRGRALFVTIFFGALTLGSVVWGEIAVLVGLPVTHFIAAAGAVFAIPLTWRWKFQTGAPLNLAPSMHWQAPITAHDVEHDRGPVLVTVEYRIDPKNRDRFLVELQKLAHERRRDGAYAWDIFEDAGEEGRFLETFLVNSWLEHLRQHERVTNADRVLQANIQRLQTQGAPRVTHLIAAVPSDPTAT
jgi:predicted MFS family arabinose efflux permease